MAYNNTNMLRIAQIGAMTRPQFNQMPTLDLGGAVDSFYGAKDASTKRALDEQNRQKMNAYIEAMSQAHPEDAARIAADPMGYVAMLDDNAKAERDQQYKMDYLAKQNANAMGLAAYQNNLRSIAAKEEKAQQRAFIDAEFEAGRMKKDAYEKAIANLEMGDKLYEIAYGKQANGGFDNKTAMELRKEHRQNNKDYYTVGDAYSRMKKVAENPSAAGDISMIFSYMKMLDPNSTVREGEYATAQNAAGIPTRVMNLYNQTLQGTRLSDLQRNDFLNQAGNLFAAQKARFDRESDYYRDIATKSGLNPDDVIYDPYDFDETQQYQDAKIQEALAEGYTMEEIQKYLNGGK